MAPRVIPHRNILHFVANYLGHPLFMPLYAYSFYWLNTDDRGPQLWINFFVVFILLCAAPLMIYPLLFKAGKIKSIHLKHFHERLWPLMINLFLWSSVVGYFGINLPICYNLGQIPNSLNAFYIGGTLCTLGALLLAKMSHKSSLHMMGIAGLFAHLFMVQTYFYQGDFPLTSDLILAFGLLASTWVAWVRYKAKAHNLLEFLSGFCLGVTTQLIAVYGLTLI